MDDAIKSLQQLIDSGDNTNLELAFILLEKMDGTDLVLPTRQDIATYISTQTPTLRFAAQLLIEDTPLSRENQMSAIYMLRSITKHNMDITPALMGNEIPAYLRWMKKLQQLGLKNTQSKEQLGWNFTEGMEHLSTSLIELDTDGNILMDAAWHHLKAVKTLRIRQNKCLTFPNNGAILNALTLLGVYHSNFNFFQLAAFPQLTKLSIENNSDELRLDLSGTHRHLTHLSVNHCRGGVRFSTRPAIFNALESISIEGTALVNFPFLPEQMPKLKEILMNADSHLLPDMVKFKAKAKKISFNKLR